jgi:peptidoglycan/xylan/chitin deacetylase (PgdA/CDA1 family)
MSEGGAGIRGVRELIINFHGVGPHPDEIGPGERLVWWDEEPFLDALDQIRIMRHQVPVSITFDDGNMSDARIALPALEQRGLHATFFVCARRIGKCKYLDKPAIDDLLKGGMRVGSHGMNHVNWRACSDDELDVEVSGSKRLLEDVLGAPVSEVAIPFGSYDRRVLRSIGKAAYSCAYTSDGGLADMRRWLRPRNTLDRTWQNSEINLVDAASINGLANLTRLAKKYFKRLR